MKECLLKHLKVEEHRSLEMEGQKINLNERSFRSSSQAATRLLQTVEASHYPFLLLNVKQY